MFVAGFIGSPAMNLVGGDLADGGVRIGAALIPLSRDLLDAASRGGPAKVTVGFRPEALDIAEPGHGLTVVVDMVEELGSDALLYAGLASHTEQAITQGHDLVARVDVRYAPAKGEPVTLRIREDALHLFDTATGLRIQP
ncbi:MAG TPA: TOBE domain-containing protein [Streptosporangiaceae bacterium]